jgi:hypothetical protein
MAAAAERAAEREATRGKIIEEIVATERSFVTR